MSKFKNTFRVESIRLKEWDYTAPWWYYVTINTKNHVPYFGKIINGELKLNKLGTKAEEFWKEIPIHFENVELDNFIIMPNHIHGIIIIDRRDVACNVFTNQVVKTKMSEISLPVAHCLSL